MRYRRMRRKGQTRPFVSMNGSPEWGTGFSVPSFQVPSSTRSLLLLKISASMEQNEIEAAYIELYTNPSLNRKTLERTNTFFLLFSFPHRRTAAVFLRGSSTSFSFPSSFFSSSSLATSASYLNESHHYGFPSSASFTF